MSNRNSLLTQPGQKKIVAPALWDEPEPLRPTYTPPPLSPQAMHRLKQRQRYPNSLSTDVIEWLRLNKPQSFEELMDLRKTLYSRKCNFGKYFVTKRGHTSLGEERYVINGT